MTFPFIYLLRLTHRSTRPAASIVLVQSPALAGALASALDFSMLRTVLSDQTYRRLGAAVFLLGVSSTWIAIWSLKCCPTVYHLPRDEGFGFTPVLVGALVLFPVVFPIVTSIFNPSKVVFSIAVALALPLFFIAGRDTANVYFDNSEAKVIIAKVIGKRDAGGWKTHNYLLQVVPQGDSRTFEFAVSYNYFQSSTEGQSIAVEVHAGFLGNSWVSRYGSPQ